MENNGKSFRLDRTAFRAHTFEEADNQLKFWLSKTPTERIQAAYYMICKSYGFNLENPPHLDRTKFVARKHPN